MLIKNSDEELFPGNPVVKIQNFLCRGHKFNSWLGTKISHAAWHSQKIKINNNKKKRKKTECTTVIFFFFLSLLNRGCHGGRYSG